MKRIAFALPALVALTCFVVMGMAFAGETSADPGSGVPGSASLYRS